MKYLNKMICYVLSFSLISISLESADNKFIAPYLKNAIEIRDPDNHNLQVLEMAAHHVKIDGVYLEMGVWSGRTINFISTLFPNKCIHGFDSFEGLPEDWIRNDTDKFARGFFKLKDESLPRVEENVQLHVGYFNETLPLFVQNYLKDKTIAFLHIDCDLYTSTKQVFDILGDYMVDGTVIVFDELYNYPGSKNHEWKAFMEFVKSRNVTPVFICYNKLHEQVAVKIKGVLQ